MLSALAPSHLSNHDVAANPDDHEMLIYFAGKGMRQMAANRAPDLLSALERSWRSG
jgi:hypothetical protein